MSKKISDKTLRALADAAVEVKKNSYSPYSRFKVGAAVLAEDGQIYAGTNIENASYGLTVCAERNAMFRGVCEGQRKFVALAVCTDPVEGDAFGTPCGACRQVMTEFMDLNAPILLVAVTKKGARKICKKKLKDPIPFPFLKPGE